MQIIDQAVVNELIELGDDGAPELLLELIDMFLDDAPNKVQAVFDSLNAADFETIERAAHSLKGSSGNLGATRLQFACESMQNASRSHDLERVRELSAELAQEFQTAMDALRAVQQQHSC